jgi:TM2 domain-containing membrane protein YozV
MITRKYQPRRNRTTAAAISFILGAVGGQRFYLRQRGPAFFMIFLLFVTWFYIAPIFFIIGIFEAVRFLSMSDQEFDRRYNRYASKNRRDD